MAEETQPGAISAAFPAPPPFYKSFTAENLEKLQELVRPSDENTSAQNQSTEPHLLSAADLSPIPAELRNLVPPALPKDGRYRSFGTLHDINPPPPVTQNIPTRKNLLGLTDRLMQLFHRYVQIMAKNPNGELWVPQWEELKRTFEQVHSVINEYRPHEARENLIIRYEDQIAQVREESERVKVSIEKARKTMEDLGSEGSAGRNALVDGQDATRNWKTVGLNGNDNSPQTKERMMWEIIERKVGRA